MYKYSLKHPVTNTRSMFFTQVEKPCFTAIKNKQNYNFVHFNLYIFYMGNSKNIPN